MVVVRVIKREKLGINGCNVWYFVCIEDLFYVILFGEIWLGFVSVFIVLYIGVVFFCVEMIDFLRVGF